MEYSGNSKSTPVPRVFVFKNNTIVEAMELLPSIETLMIYGLYSYVINISFRESENRNEEVISHQACYNQLQGNASKKSNKRSKTSF